MNSWLFVNLSSIILWSWFQVIWATHFNISIMRAHNSQSTLIPHLSSYLPDCEHSGCSSTFAPLRACRPLTAPQLLIFSLQPVLGFFLCLFYRAFQYTLLDLRSCINVTVLFILQAAWRQTCRTKLLQSFLQPWFVERLPLPAGGYSWNPHHLKAGRSQMLCLRAAYHSVYRAGST